MFDFGAPELLIVLVIVVLLFGPGRIAKTRGEVGKGIRSFKVSFSAEEKSDSVLDTNVNLK
jgi:sec-independent protein translocase protein TatA